MKKAKENLVSVIFTAVAPEGCKKVYILGNSVKSGRWQTYAAKKMTRINNSNVFYKELQIPVGKTVEYKYLRKRDWTGVECGQNGEELTNRKIYLAPELSFSPILSTGAPYKQIDKISNFRRMVGDK